MAFFIFSFVFIFQAPIASAREPGYSQKVPPLEKCAGNDLFQAVRLRRMECLKKSSKHMSVNETDLLGDTPLHLAIRQRNGEAIPFLLKLGANLRYRNHSLQTPMELAEASGYRALAEYFAGIELETDRLVSAIEENNLPAVRASLKRGASLGTCDLREDCPLHRAVQSNFVEIAKVLLKAGAEVDAKNYLGETPLHGAALRGFSESMEALLEAGADSSAVNWRRETPLDIAFTRQDHRAFKLLKKFKAKRGYPVNAGLDVAGDEMAAPAGP